jgi:drug/metabolite transporter (DMT)-like permease
LSANVLSIIAAFTFALSSVLQQRGALNAKAGANDPNLMKELLHSPVWVVGGLLNILACVIQVMALNRGSFVVVQSLCSLSLVFALPLGARFSGQVVGRRSIIGAGIALLGILTLVILGQPQGSGTVPAGSDWLTIGLIIAALVFVFYRLARNWQGAVAAALFGMAAGLCYAFEAAVSKEFVLHFGAGLQGILFTWSTYVLIGAWFAGFVLEQSWFKTGFLAAGLAACNSISLAASVILGVTLFGEMIARDQTRLPPVALGLALATVGVLLLAFPETRSPEPAKL